MGAGALVISVGVPVGFELLGRSSRPMRRAPSRRRRRSSSPPTSRSMPTAPSRPTSARWTWASGLFVAIGQIVAEELDVPFRAVTVYMGDTATSVNQGGASGSTGIQFGGKQMRMAAAEARRVLVEMAADEARHAGRPAHGRRRRGARRSAAQESDQLRRTDRRQVLQRPARLEQADGQRALCPRQGAAQEASEHKIVGQPIKREDVAPKVFAQEDYVVDIKVPGMVHGRVIRPAIAGAVPVKVDESSIKDIPGAQVVHRERLHRRGRRQGVGRHQGDAAAQGRVVEGRAAVPEPERALRPHPQGAGAQERRSRARPTGNVDEAFKTARRK